MNEVMTIAGRKLIFPLQGERRAIIERAVIAIETETRALTETDLRMAWIDDAAARDREIAALRAAPLDVRMVVQAINAVAKRHGVAKDPPERPLMHIFGYTSATPDMDAEIAAEYAALAAAKETP